MYTHELKRKMTPGQDRHVSDERPEPSREGGEGNLSGGKRIEEILKTTREDLGIKE